MSQQVGRLALREEGLWWKAYYAKQDTMQDALLLGQIQLNIVANDTKNSRARKREFIMLMQAAVTDIIEDIIGTRPTWPEPPQTAPEHERKA